MKNKPGNLTGAFISFIIKSIMAYMVVMLPLKIQSQGNTVKVYGKVVSEDSSHPMVAATVIIRNNVDSVILWQGLTTSSGVFSSTLPTQDYLLQITFSGYQPNTILLRRKDSTGELNAGIIKLFRRSTMMEEVIINTQPNTMDVQPDKKVFNLESTLAAKGGSAIDALRTIPSILISADGRISLRDGVPLILVDGKRTPLNLNQIPADQIQSIEVITNPSAKYDAQGSHGLINIIMKTDRKVGINGTIRSSYNSQHVYSTGLDANVRKRKWNVSINYFRRTRKDVSKVSVDRSTGVDNRFRSETAKDGKEYFQRGKLGIDYYLNAANTFNIDGDLGGGYEDYLNQQHIRYFSPNLTNDSSLNRINPYTEKFSFWHGNFSFTHKFKTEDEKLIFYGGVVEYKQPGTGQYVTSYSTKDGIAAPNPFMQHYETGYYNKMVTLQADYVLPLKKKKAKLETGIKITLNKGSYENHLYDYRYDSLHYSLNYKASYSYTFKDPTYAAYGNFSDQYGNFSYIAGLRFENYDYKGLSKEGTTVAAYKTTGVFPGIFLSYKLSIHTKLQLNYSRRIRRPVYSEISPVTDYTDPQNLIQGNPGLKPELTNLFELSYNRSAGNNVFTGTLYMRQAGNFITAFTSPLAADTFISRYINARSAGTAGAEIISKNKINAWLNTTSSLNLLYTSIRIDNAMKNISNSGYSWYGKINGDIKLPWSVTLQVTGNYIAPRVVPQGTVKSSGSLDLSLGKYFFKGKALSLDATLFDIFNTDRTRTVIQNPGLFTQTTNNKPQSRLLRISCSYRFKK